MKVKIFGLVIFLIVILTLGAFWFIVQNKPQISETKITSESSAIDIKTLAKNEVPILKDIIVLKPLSLTDKELWNDKLKIERTIQATPLVTFEGIADKTIESVLLTSKCNGEFLMGTGQVIRPVGTPSIWKWNITIGTSQMCLGKNTVTITPSTCLSEEYPNNCKFSKFVLLDSSNSRLHPRTITIDSPKPNEKSISEKKSIIFSGMAGKEVENIKVTTACIPSRLREEFATIIQKPKDTNNNWKWSFEYTEGLQGICRGNNYIDFFPSTCTEACRLQKNYSFLSHVGFLDSNDLALFQLPNVNVYDTEFLNSRIVTLHGAAGVNVGTVMVKITCGSFYGSQEDHIYQPNLGRKATEPWEWSYTLDTDKKTLCRGINELSFWADSVSPHKKIYSFNFFSNVGYVPDEIQKKVDVIKKFETHTIKNIDDIKEDKNIAIELASDNSEYNSACRDITMMMDDELEKVRAAPRLLAKQKISNSNIIIQLRLPREGEDTDNSIGLNISTETPILEFISNHASDILLPPKIVGWPCGTKVIVYYIRPDRIIVDLGTGYESPNLALFLTGCLQGGTLNTNSVDKELIDIGDENYDLLIPAVEYVKFMEDGSVASTIFPDKKIDDKYWRVEIYESKSSNCSDIGNDDAYLRPIFNRKEQINELNGSIEITARQIPVTPGAELAQETLEEKMREQGYRDIFCSVNNDQQVTIIISQMSDNPTLAKEIFETFKWIN